MTKCLQEKAFYLIGTEGERTRKHILVLQCVDSAKATSPHYYFIVVLSRPALYFYLFQLKQAVLFIRTEN